MNPESREIKEERTESLQLTKRLGKKGYTELLLADTPSLFYSGVLFCFVLEWN